MSYSKRVAITTIGFLLEAFEFGIYAFIGYRIAPLFFPEDNITVQLLKIYGIFAAGCFMRPIGGLIFGGITDKLGRRKALLASMTLMAIATIGIVIIPTYAQVGILAPILLLCYRILQGVAGSSEFDGGSIFLIEQHKNKYRNLAGSWGMFGSGAGFVLASLSAYILSLPNMPDWAWRVPFFLGFIGSMYAYCLRKELDKTLPFEEGKIGSQTKEIPVTDPFKHYNLAVIIPFAFAALLTSDIYMCNIYFADYLRNQGHIEVNTIHLIITSTIVVLVAMVPVMAIIADKVGGRRMINTGLITAILGAPLLFIAGKTGSLLYILPALGLFVFWDAAICAPAMLYIFKYFPTPIRYSTQSISWSIGAALLAGASPLMGVYLVERLNLIYGPGFYMSLLALFVYLSIRLVENAGTRRV